MTRVFVAAPTPMMRAGLRAMLASDDIEVVGEAASLADMAPGAADADVLVVTAGDLRESTAREVAGEGGLSMVVLADDEQPAAILRSLPLHGWGIVPSDSPPAELQAAVNATGQGLIVVPVPVGERLLSRTGSQVSLERGPLDEPLTARELEVLQLLSQGLSNKLIARKLQISEHTVKFHISSLYTKLGASSRTDAVNRGARSGLISF